MHISGILYLGNLGYVIVRILIELFINFGVYTKFHDLTPLTGLMKILRAC